MYAWVAEVLELPARRTLRVGGGGSRVVGVSYSSEELCHEAAHVVLRLRHELASNRQQLASIRQGTAQPQLPPPSPLQQQQQQFRSPKARPSTGRKTRRSMASELATQTEAAEAEAAQTQTEISSLEITADAESQLLTLELSGRVRQLHAMFEQSEADNRLLRTAAQKAERQRRELSEALGLANCRASSAEATCAELCRQQELLAAPAADSALGDLQLHGEPQP
jgi:DNA-binding protein YbaB